MRSVYIIQCAEFVKIGIADDVAQRLNTLQIGHPVKLKLVATFRTNDPFRMERELHNMLGPHHVRGEWFHLNDVVKAWVEQAKSIR